MAALLRRLVKIGIALLLAPLVLAFTVSAVAFLGATLQDWLQSWFTIGFLLSAPLWFFLMLGGNSFLQTLEHELNHAILAKIARRRVERLEVTPYASSQKGVVEFASGCGCMTIPILLAPYYVPLFTLPFLVVRPLASQPTVQNALDLLIGITYAFHVVGLGREFRRHQTDLQEAGCLFATVVIVLLNAITLAVIIAAITDLSTLPDYFAQAIELAQEYYAAAWAGLQDVLGGL